MKTIILAVVLMTLTVPAEAATATLQAGVRPTADFAWPRTTPSPLRVGLVAPIRVTALDTTWLTPLESQVGVVVSAPPLRFVGFHAQLFIDGSLAEEVDIAPGTSRAITTVLKSDGLRHDMEVRVYREVIDRPRTLALQRTFDAWLPAQ